MKARIFILIAMVIFAAACEKDPLSKGPSFSDGKPGKNNAELHLPFKASFTTLPDTPTDLGGGMELSLGGFISGNATYVGLIDAAESPYTVDFSNLVPEFDEAGDPVKLTQPLSGIITASNGDYYTYSGVAVISFLDGSLNGTMDFTGGVGRFDGVSGSIVITGTANPLTSEASFSGEGVIIFPK